jgi:hypothetical protein
MANFPTTAQASSPQLAPPKTALTTGTMAPQPSFIEMELALLTIQDNFLVYKGPAFHGG